MAELLLSTLEEFKPLAEGAVPSTTAPHARDGMDCDCYYCCSIIANNLIQI